MNDYDKSDHASDQMPGHDDLLAPSLQEYERRRFDSLQQKPWRLQPQFWVAFFGGVLPVAVIAYLNSKRLNIPEKRSNQILIIGALGFIVVVIVGYILAVSDIPASWTENRRGIRLANRIIAVLVYLNFYSIQKSADRVYQFQTEGEYSSLWKPGLLAVFGLGLLQNIILLGLITLLTTAF